MTSKLDYVDTVDATCKLDTCEIHSDGTYQLRASCKNCGWKGSVLLSRGHPFAPSTKCPTCDTPNLSKFVG